MDGDPVQHTEDDDEDEVALRGVWLSRLMFGWIADANLRTTRYTETRSWPEYHAAARPAPPAVTHTGR